MGFFKRKKKLTSTMELPVLPHNCIMKDMPWYMTTEYNGEEKTASYEIIEPYICITCGKRIDKVLEKHYWSNITSDWRDKMYEEVREKYKKYLKPRAIVEDMINNIILVKDAKRLEMIEEMRGLPHRNCGTSAEMERNEDAENDIGNLIIPKEDKDK